MALVRMRHHARQPPTQSSAADDVAVINVPSIYSSFISRTAASVTYCFQPATSIMKASVAYERVYDRFYVGLQAG